jgi:CRISPR-associated endonuclease Csn1
MDIPVTTPDVSFSFDIGDASIGWAALSTPPRAIYPQVLGCGVLLFPKDDCQNHLRAQYRRQRRHIAATRNRVARIRRLLVEMGALTELEAQAQTVAASGIMMPWLYAARAIHGAALTWPELWQVLRFYAHNRGYDGNARWARAGEETTEDTQKVQNANALMERFHTHTMAETICAFLGVNPDDANPHLGEKAPYFKGESVAFRREIVRGEVEKLIRSQFGKLALCDAAFLSLLMGRDLTAEEKKRFKLPQRYSGGLLFGQMIPRFDNRIISTCPVTGEKTPLKHCTDYYRYRWARLLANLRVKEDGAADKRALTASERAELTSRMEKAGGLTKVQLKKALEEITHADAKGLDDQFFSPETEKALVLDPVRDALSGAPFENTWPLVPEALQRRLAGEFFKSGRLSLAQLLAAVKKSGADVTGIENAIRLDFAQAVKHARKNPPTFESFIDKPKHLAEASGRAPYSRTVMHMVYEEALSGMDPAAIADSQPASAPGKRDGCIAITNEFLDREAEKRLEDMTNNHLVRQRMTMFRRLFGALFKTYAGASTERVAEVTIEVARDLQEYAGKNAKEKAALFSEKAKPFQKAEAVLRKGFEEAGIAKHPSYAMIRKARIAMAQNWICPYTGRHFSAADIAYDRVDFEHIIPHASRRSDALEGLAITFRDINKRKGKRTALEFIRSGEEDLMTEARFREFVAGLYPKFRPGRDASDEDKINWRRKEWFLKEDYDERDAEFTKAALTVTSHLNKLAALEARKILRKSAKAANLDDAGRPEHRVGHMVGAITGEFRKEKSWDLLGCIEPVCPEIIDPNSPEKRHLPKGEIRNITHLHHAVDAITIGIARNIFPGHVVRREVCEAILSRRPNPAQRAMLEAMGVFYFDKDGGAHLRDMPEELRENIIEKLAECRVVQHVPKSMHGLRAELTQWGVSEYDAESDRVKLVQYTRDADNGKVRKRKEAWENPRKLLGYNPVGESKLKPRKAAIVISDNFGIALLPEPVVLPFHKVWERLHELAEKNEGKIPTVLRQGDVIDVPNGRYKGRWKIHSTKDCAVGIQVDMAWPHLVKLKDKMKGYARNIMLKTLVKDGMTIVRQSLIGS